jgi:hypothetical protein
MHRTNRHRLCPSNRDDLHRNHPKPQGSRLSGLSQFGRGMYPHRNQTRRRRLLGRRLRCHPSRPHLSQGNQNIILLKNHTNQYNCLVAGL